MSRQGLTIQDYLATLGENQNQNFTAIHQTLSEINQRLIKVEKQFETAQIGNLEDVASLKTVTVDSVKRTRSCLKQYSFTTSTPKIVLPTPPSNEDLNVDEDPDFDPNAEKFSGKNL